MHMLDIQPLGALMIYNLILSLLVLCLSGYLMTTDMFWGTEWTEELHELAAIWDGGLSGHAYSCRDL